MFVLGGLPACYTLNKDGSPALPDRILRYIAADGYVRIILSETTDACEEARNIHRASPVAAAAMGKALSATLMLASELKGGGSISVTVAGDGPLGKIIAVARPDGTGKVCCSDPSVDLPVRADGQHDIAGAVGTQGRLTVVKDLGLREPWVGQVDLVSGELGQDFATYLLRSEQQPSIVSLGVLTARDYRVISAGGIIVQPMPGCPEEILTELESAAPAVADISRKLRDMGGEKLAASAFPGLNPVQVGSIPVKLQCDCSRERVERALISLGAAELSHMIRKDGGAEVCCQFCGAKHTFTTEELEALMRAAQKRKR